MSEASDNTFPRPSDASPFMPVWLRATAEDVASVDFEAPLAGAMTANTDELSGLYREAALEPDGGALGPRDGSTEPPDTPAIRVFTLLSAVTGMHFKPEERNEPFGPMLVLADGIRSAIPADFRGHVAILAAMAELAANPVLRARLCDVCRLLDRKRGDLALAALIDSQAVMDRDAGPS
jgi:hypothetical protein